MSGPTTPPKVAGIHHLKVPVTNIEASLAWYTRVMGAEHLKALDHVDSNGQLYGVILNMPSFGKTMMELRLDAAQAKSQQGFDPITWGVDGLADLEQWDRWLTANGVAHSKVLKGVVGWVLAFEDPDKRFLRLYTYETHEMTSSPDTDAYWLR